MDTQTATTTSSSPPPATKPGLRTTEFWITLAVLIVNHLTAALRANASPTAMVAAAVVDAVATAGYAIARAISKMNAPLVLVALLVLAGPATSCATFNGAAKACADQLTPELKQIAGAALEGQDYEVAIARDLGPLTACLRRAAVAAATDWAKHAKASGAVDQAAIARHGDAWLSAHQKDADPPPAPVSAISPAPAGSTSRRSAARGARGSRSGASTPPGRPPSHGRAWSAARRGRRQSRRPSRRLRSGRIASPSVLQVA